MHTGRCLRALAAVQYQILEHEENFNWVYNLSKYHDNFKRTNHRRKPFRTSAEKLEDTMTLPEGMLSETDSLYLDWISKNYINLGENCVATDNSPEISDSIYIERLQRIPAIIEMPYNEIVRKFIDMYATRLRQKLHLC